MDKLSVNEWVYFDILGKWFCFKGEANIASPVIAIIKVKKWKS